MIYNKILTIKTIYKDVSTDMIALYAWFKSLVCVIYLYGMYSLYEDNIMIKHH